MVNISDEQIRLSLSMYGFVPSDQQCEAIRSYIYLLLRWNKKVSLTAITSHDEILRLHFGESLFALQHLAIQDGRLADVGSGAGFPGLALKIARPSMEIVLLEPNQKKATFLREIGRELRLRDVQVRRTRFENLPSEIGEFEYITARALGPHEALARFAESRLAGSGKLILWIGKEDSLKAKSSHILEWLDPVLIPGSKRRLLLIGSRKQ